VFLAPVYKINNEMSVGVTLKSVWQEFDNPKLVAKEQDGSTPYNFFINDSIRKQNFDADLSFNYKINNSLQAGISVMNVFDSKLYANMFIADSANQSYINQRSYGAGISYKRGRLNAGIDALFTDNDFYDATLGINYVPFNDGLIAGGYAFKQQSFSLSFSLKNFKIAYINDNNLVINDVRVAKSKLFDGKIYSGFVFDF